MRGFMTHDVVCTDFISQESDLFEISRFPGLDQNDALPTWSFDLIGEELEYLYDSAGSPLLKYAGIIFIDIVMW